MTRYLRVAALILLGGSAVFAQGSGATNTNHAWALNGSVDLTTTLPGGSTTTESLDVSISGNETRTTDAAGNILSGEMTLSVSIGDQTHTARVRGGAIGNANGQHTILYVIRWTRDGVTYTARMMTGHTDGHIGGVEVSSHNSNGTVTIM